MRKIDADALITDCKKYLDMLNPERDQTEFAKVYWLIGILKNAPSVQLEQDDWTPVNGTPPRDGQKCLLTVDHFNSVSNRYVDIGTYSSNLYEIDNYNFYIKKGKPGWYHYDSVYGLCEILDIKAWKPLDEPYMGD